MTSTLARLLVTFLFLLSGAAALIYQVAWQRLLVVFAGGDVYSVTLIVAAFMLGLGLGSLAGGHLADRLSPMRNLLLFAGAEALIAAYGFFSSHLYYDVLYERLGSLAASRLSAALILFACLILPTFLMGLSLPVLARAMSGALSECAARIGGLYAVNTFGAALGALAATWYLLPRFGLEGGIAWAARLNVFCALAVIPAALLLRRRAGAAATPADASVPAPASADADTPADAPPTPPPSGPPAGRPLPLRGYFLIYAFSGFLALALELLWFRLLGVMLKSTASTFGTLLAVYLGGIGLGAWLGAWLARRSTRPGTVFFFLQAGVGLYAGFAITLTLAAVAGWPALAPLHDYFDSYEPVDANTAVLLLRGWLEGTNSAELNAKAWIFPTLHLGLPLLLMGPSTLLMGISFPFLQKAVQTNAAHIGRRVGWLQSANIAGSVLGTVAMGLVALPFLGTALTLKLLVALSGLFALAGLAQWLRGASAGRRLAAQCACLLLLACGISLMPGQSVLWARVHGSTVDRIISAEDGAGVSVLKKPLKPGDPIFVFVSGIGQSWLPFDGIHSVLGALPALLHPAPEDIAVIGLGSGDTLFSVGCRAETRSIVCVEIISAQKQTLESLAQEGALPGLTTLLADKRIEWIHGDGRLHLMHTGRRFDIIEADALRPTSAHAGNLYSEAYFRLLASRLKPRGMAVTWCPTQRVLDTFVKVFPHVLVFGPIVVGSNDAVDLSPQTLGARINDPAIRAYYERAGIALIPQLTPFVGQNAKIGLVGPDHNREALLDLNTDLFPKDELNLPALWPDKKPAQLLD